MERAEEAGEGEAGGSGTRFDPASFVGLVIGLATQAQVFLGAIENPITRKKEEVDLERAKNLVDVLGMLEKKTAGNLTKEESDFLVRLLGDLRMRYVQARMKA